jgi:tRNA(Ile)-lysidine synthase
VRERLPAHANPCFCIALSGGLDSSVLLHALAALRPQVPGMKLRAVHVDHGLQAASADWARHCQTACKNLNVELTVLPVEVTGTKLFGPEAAARNARYAALARVLLPEETLLLAQHQDDQAETYLLQLMRGGGVHGLSGMPATAAFAAGKVLRPLLGSRRVDLQAYAEAACIEWVEDPTNADSAFDRNFVRHQLLPVVKQRWSEAAPAIARSARYAAEAAELTEALAAIDATGVWDGCSAGIPELLRLPELRQRNLLRYLIRSAGLAVPSEVRLQEIWNSLLFAAADAQPRVRWRGGFAARYRDRLFVLPAAADSNPDPATFVLERNAAVNGKLLELGEAIGLIGFRETVGQGLDPRLLQWPLQLRFREGGERLRPQGAAHSRSLKNLLQERGVLPWRRNTLPLFYSGDALVAIGDMWLANEYCVAVGEPGLVPVWESTFQLCHPIRESR